MSKFVNVESASLNFRVSNSSGAFWGTEIYSFRPPEMSLGLLRRVRQGLQEASGVLRRFRDSATVVRLETRESTLNTQICALFRVISTVDV
jgi:hypothetical protein